MDPKLKKWISWLRVIHDEVRRLLIVKNIFWEVQDIIKSNKNIQKPSAFYQYLGDTYISHALIGVRRHLKSDKQSISFAGLLEEIIAHPNKLSRKYYTGLYVGSNVENMADSNFDRASGGGKEYVSKDMVVVHLRRLKNAGAKLEEFADRRIAHWDKRRPKTLPKFHEVDACIDLMDDLYVKYHMLFHAQAMDSLMPTYQYDWKEVFYHPWIELNERI